MTQVEDVAQAHRLTMIASADFLMLPKDYFTVKKETIMVPPSKTNTDMHKQLEGDHLF